MDLVPTSATSWAAPYQEGVVVGFPSGNLARIRPITFETFLRIGHIPDPLTSFMIEIMDGGKYADGKLKMPDLHSKQQWEEWFSLLNSICVSCFVEPQVVLPSDDPLPPGSVITDMISYEDKLHLYACLGASIERLKAFFLRSAERVATVAASTGNAQGRIANHADRGMGDEPTGDAGHLDGTMRGQGGDVLRDVDRVEAGDPRPERKTALLA